jgi:ABC-type uncharacterized transport system YnjBCD permease subunit
MHGGRSCEFFSVCVATRVPGLIFEAGRVQTCFSAFAVRSGYELCAFAVYASRRRLR